jgi:hypothetical protein
MTQRERAASAETEAVTRPGSGYHSPAPARGPSGVRPHRPPAWEDIYRAVSAEQQHELLSLAERQGVLYAHQLPELTNGSAVDPSRQLLTRILGGAVAELPPLHAEPIAVGDQDLDAVQREAIAKALATPDILLLQGRSGSGKSRVVAEIIACAAAAGQRVLLLASTAAAIDRVLQSLASRDVVLPVRCVERDENVAALPAAIRALTFPERARALSLHAREAARDQIESGEQRASRLQQDEACWGQLEELARRWPELEAHCQALEKQRSQLAGVITEEANAIPSAASDGFASLLEELTRSHQEACAQAETRSAELHGRIDTARQEQAALDVELQALAPLAQAKQQGRWWSGAWWRATIHGKSILARWTQGQEHRQQLQADLDALHEQMAGLTRLREETENLFASKKAGLIAAEIARRQTELDDRLGALRREQNVLRQKWHHLLQSLAPESPRPAEMSAQAVQAARAAWRQRLEQLAEQHAFTRQWSAYLEETPTALAARLPSYVNLVAATLTAFARDEHFGDQVTTAVPRDDFDLLIMEEAEQLSESEFLQATRRARRCVLVGETLWPEESTPVARRPGPAVRPSKGSSSGSRSAALVRPGVFQRLWQHLHCDPRQLPYSWTYEKDRLCCHLNAVSAEQRQWLAIEHVADCPDIELRILSAPRCQHVLAEIVFPSSFSLDRAKQYIFQELEELAVQPTGSHLCWLDQGDRLVLRLADRDLAHGPSIDLAPGVREVLGATGQEANGNQEAAIGWQTCCLEFDRAAGWDRSRASQWVREHLGLRDLGRTIRLDTCYRMQPSLAALVSSFLSVAELSANSATAREAPAALSTVQFGERNGWSAPVEFLPVPPPHETTGTQGITRPAAGQRKAGMASPNSRPGELSHGRLPVKGGAGLEIDLAESRHRERLPAELRAELPHQGFVNYSEAQAVLRTLAGFFQKSGQPPASAWPAVAILALYPAQAELIRRLLREDSVLAARSDEIEVGIPADFRQREAGVVFVSLTRSHTHRAVTFGESPQMLALALTRARSQLVLFGDPGTLWRRSQWEGPLEHLGAEAAAHERQLLSRLLQCLQACALPPTGHVSPLR